VEWEPSDWHWEVVRAWARTLSRERLAAFINVLRDIAVRVAAKPPHALVSR
jgi:hypothetical protein